jgi:hypothetical protein
MRSIWTCLDVCFVTGTCPRQDAQALAIAVEAVAFLVGHHRNGDADEHRRGY